MTDTSKKLTLTLTDSNLDQSPLTDTELDILSEFLSTLDHHDEALSLSALDGYFNALAIAPELISTSEWLTWVLGELPSFDTEQQAQQIVALLIRHHHQVQVGMRETSPPDYAPLFLFSEHSDMPWVSDWCHGFIAGVHSRSDAWLAQLKHESDGAMLDLIYAMTVLAPPDFEHRPANDELGEDEVDQTSIAMRRMVHEALDDYRAHFDPIAGWEVLLEVCVMHLRDHLLHPNKADLCPCGSGKVFTDCCGSRNRQLH
jgi:uncharacterized protein